MVTRIGPMIPGLGVNYTSPANAPRSNAINIRQTGATSGEANRYANMAPAGTTTSPLSRPASANSALGLGERNASVVPPSLSSTRAPSPVPTLIPGALDMQGRMGGAGVSTTSTGGIRAAAGASATTPGGGSSEPGLPATGGRPAAGGSTGPGASAGGSTAPGGSDAASDAAEAPVETPAEDDSGGTSPINAAAALDSEIRKLLDPEYIGFQGDRASELRRLQNLRNQLFGDAQMGSTGSIARQEKMDADGRRRLAAQRAMSGMLQGGAYSGLTRGVGVMQRANQDFAMQEMRRPFREATASDRLREFGLEFDPTSRIFDQTDFKDVLPEYKLNPDTGELEYVAEEGEEFFGISTQAGREAAARAKLAAMQILAQRGSQI